MKLSRAHLVALAILTTCGLAIASAKKPPQVGSISPTAVVDPNAPRASHLLPFHAPCQVDAECATGTCNHFVDRGSFCSQPCAVKGDCPTGSTCNRKHFCK